MKYLIHVKTRARETTVERQSDGSFRVAVMAAPIAGRANEAVIALLAKYFGVPKSCLAIVAGSSSRKKWVEVL
ncbi:MAG: DUF167 domain-containing protein [Deltaproteobacteria bacterium]|nr:DUF167 domain-containing protein [Deltaproteobacteria bacterium]